ncbi:helix-turn-helix domain-containing protein [bacterium]|nr:MAG: helix-turn-helix domain-containing protein [bacterium]
MQAGQSFTIVRDDETLTTQMAADLLGVSRPFLIGLLEENKIPYHKAGTHRRVRLQDLLAYRRERDSQRRKTLDDYFDAVVAEGAYD